MTGTTEPLTTEEIRQRYDEFSRWYDIVEGIPEMFGIRLLRRKLGRRVRGRALEVAAGTGRNHRFILPDVELLAGDLSIEMLDRARRKAQRRGFDAWYCQFDAEQLPFADNTFDSVLSSLSSCTFPDPVMAFREMSRVCKPEGRILLLEHGRSNVRPFAWYQDRRADKHARVLGCRWNQNPIALARDAGLNLADISTHFFGVFAVMEARPDKTG